MRTLGCTDSEGNELMKDILEAIGCHVLWAVVAVGIFYCVSILRELYLVVFAFLGMNHWVIGAVDRFALVGMTVIGFGLLIWFLDMISKKGLRAFLLVAAVQVILVTAMQLTRSLLLSTLSPHFLNNDDLLVFGVSLALGLGFLKARQILQVQQESRA